jgi:kynurenine formamidase
MIFAIARLTCVISLLMVMGTQASAARLPYLIFVHGGAWVSGSPEAYSKLADSLRTQGYCAVVAKYSLAPQAKHPVPVNELNETIVKTAKSSSAGCDSKRIYLIGHSAGAHMIAFWNTAFTNSAVKGFIGLEGIYDLPLLLKKWPAYEDQFITAEFGKERESVSPARLKAKSKTRWLLIQSKEDELVDGAQTQVFKTFLDDQKISTRLVETSGTHFDAVSQLEKADSTIAKAVSSFVNGK